jgi:Protein of unknown function (DUF4236)
MVDPRRRQLYEFRNILRSHRFMGYFRFHRSKQILPGVRLNLAKNGPSVSLGVKGARMNVGPQGIRTTVGVPGSGLSYVFQQSWGSKTSRTASQTDPLAFMDAMNLAEKQAFFTAQLKGKSIPRLQAERLAFEEAIACHTEQLSEPEQADFEWMRTQYQRAIVTKWRDFGLAFLAVVVAAGSVPLATETQNYSLLWAFFVAPIVFAISPPGRRSPLMLLAAILSTAGVFVIGVIALVIWILVVRPG